MYYFTFNCFEYFYDFCVVWTPETATDRINYKLAAVWRCVILVDNCTCRIFVSGSGK